ncbi:MAG TPA: alpha/beta hydrolase [Thermoanaerobaculia bacterium]|nr:alpha/beta hydrolase [Thermoanaerobaculia bacterium]
MLRSLLILAVIAVVVLFSFTQFARRTSMFYPTRFPLGQWDTSAYSPAPREQIIVTADQVRLHAWHFPARDPAAPLMIWFHGNGGNISDRGPMAAEFAKRGLSVLLFDWRGYGKSDGKPTEQALYRDGAAAHRHAREALGIKPTDIVLYGESLGGPYAADMARRHGARCVVIENSFPSLTAMGNLLYSPMPLGWFVPRAMRTADWLNEAGLPVLIMHGRRDEVIPFELGKKLYDELRVPKHLLVSERAGHCEIASAEGARYYDAVVRFATNPTGNQERGNTADGPTEN